MSNPHGPTFPSGRAAASPECLVARGADERDILLEGEIG